MDQRVNSETDFKVVALVSSAGGLKASSSILTALPADLPAAILMLQHSEPDRASQLAHIIARLTSAPVEMITDGTPLRAGVVLIAPPGAHSLVDSGLTVRLIASGAYPPSRPSADLLLTTLALAGGNRVIAVVLTGGGTDGATGATAVHTFGGCVIVSDEASSENFSMPAATIDRDNVTDIILPLDQIAPVLIDLVTAQNIPPTPSGQAAAPP